MRNFEKILTLPYARISQTALFSSSSRIWRRPILFHKTDQPQLFSAQSADLPRLLNGYRHTQPRRLDDTLRRRRKVPLPAEKRSVQLTPNPNVAVRIPCEEAETAAPEFHYSGISFGFLHVPDCTSCWGCFKNRGYFHRIGHAGRCAVCGKVGTGLGDARAMIFGRSPDVYFLLNLKSVNLLTD